MAAVTSGIWSHAAQVSSPLGGAKAMDDSSGSSGDSSTAGATISANDFLTLLVTEMQNQDPTADTDPNEYINQLVNVNSLEQLISINQTLTTAMGGSTSSSSSQSTAATGVASTSQNVSSASHAPTSATAAHAASTTSAHPSTAAVVSGNLSTSEANPSALRVAKALDHPRFTR